MKKHNLVHLLIVAILVIACYYTDVAILFVIAIVVAIAPLFYNADDGEEEF
jgi:hypothetical protein